MKINQLIKENNDLKKKLEEKNKIINELQNKIKELDAEFEIKIKPADVIPDQFDSVQQICELIELYFGK